MNNRLSRYIQQNWNMSEFHKISTNINNNAFILSDSYIWHNYMIKSDFDLCASNHLHDNEREREEK